jgi:hypothetical protein
VASGQWWLPGREELAVYFGEESNRTVIFGERDDWNSPLRTLTDPLGSISPDRRLRAWESSTGDGTRLFLGPFVEPGEPRLIAETKEGGFEVFGFARGGNRFLYWMTDEAGADVWSYGMDFYMAGGPKPLKTGVSTLVSGVMSLSQSANTLAAATGDEHLIRQEPARWSAPSIPSGPRTADKSPGPRDRTPIRLIVSSGDVAVWASRSRSQTTPATTMRCHYDEMPVWSRDGSHILFGRRDEQDARSLWLMRSDGSEPREVAGPFLLQSNVPDGWSDMFDWSFC